MAFIKSIVQPTPLSTKSAVRIALERHAITEIDIAAAYVTNAGIYDLLSEVHDVSNITQSHIKKRWLTSFDYLRSEPGALSCLSNMSNAEVRVFEASKCLHGRGIPRVPFHPKSYLLRNDEEEYLLAGSGNLSRSGLARGYETGILIGGNRSSDCDEQVVEAIDRAKEWFEQAWGTAVSLTPTLLSQYDELFQDAANLKNPVPTEDDIATTDTVSGALNSQDLRKLRVCSNLWIEAGNITQNRGRGLPGNQLMMKRMSRVFFGFPPEDWPENTMVGEIQISFNEGHYHTYSLSYSDNKMDKLGLPIPGTSGPDRYDGKCLLFTTRGPRQFALNLTSGKAQLRRASKKVDGSFKMKSGREWGVF